MNSQVIVLCVIATMCGVSMAMVKPAIPLKDLNPIDACLFGCNMCFEGPFLLECANKACLHDLVTGKPLDTLMAKMCPGLLEFFNRK